MSLTKGCRLEGITDEVKHISNGIKSMGGEWVVGRRSLVQRSL